MHGVRRLSVIDDWGVGSGSIEFLRALGPQLHALYLSDQSVVDLEPLHTLVELRSLTLTTAAKTCLDFSNFPKLEECYIYGRIKTRGLYGHPNLRLLYMYPREKDLSLFANMPNLRSLTIISRTLESLNGIANLKDLTHLEIHYASRLRSLEGIQALTKLNHLSVSTCRGITDVSPIGSLVQLEELALNNNGNIDSFKPLLALTNLRSLGFYETTNVVDGDLSLFDRLPHLTKVAFQNRPHYSHCR
jgi:Leucine-rich repeat (LRR) protein